MNHFLVNDINAPLIQLMEQCINNPSLLSETYTQIWNGQFAEGQNNVDYYHKIREEFNTGMVDPARMLFLLTRVQRCYTIQYTRIDESRL